MQLASDPSLSTQKRNRKIAIAIAAIAVLRLITVAASLSEGVTLVRILDPVAEALISSYLCVTLLGGANRRRNFRIVTFLIVPIVLAWAGVMLLTAPKQENILQELKPYNDRIREIYSADSSWSTPQEIDVTMRELDSLKHLSDPLLKKAIEDLRHEVKALESSPIVANPDTAKLLAFNRSVLRGYELQSQERDLLGSLSALWSGMRRKPASDSGARAAFSSEMRALIRERDGLESAIDSNGRLIKAYIRDSGMGDSWPRH